jgi:phosphatidylserine/phosphatidylglycerophosphate/cardiolipin synthase-like enzyme
MSIADSLRLAPIALAVILTAWAMLLYQRRKYPNLLYIIGLVCLLSSIYLNAWQNAEIIYAPYDESSPKFTAAFSPKQGATDLVVDTIQSANRSIYVAAYYFTSKPIADALAAARRRGVDIKIVLDRSQNGARGNMLEYFAANDIPVRINNKYKIMHNKYMIIDGQTLQLGSFNYTESAETKNAENVLVISNDEALVKNYQSNWQKLWQESYALTTVAYQ